MKDGHFHSLLILVLISMLMLLVGLYLLANFKRLFRRQIKNELLRKNIVVWLIAICFVFCVLPTHPDFLSQNEAIRFFLLQSAGVTVEVLFVFNISNIVARHPVTKNAPFKKRMGIILATIILCTIIISIGVNFLFNNGSFKSLQFVILFSFYTGCMAGLTYVTMNYVDLERKRKLNEKELEVTLLRELKTKAELEALHSKINPHFLYNALNSIADLSITDGKKARKMTVALADLFRYSINYSENNYSTVRDEVEMAEVYLQIEKIRFEDKLNYAIHVDPDIDHYLLPRFVLQPVVENAVKHGLKATGKITQINIAIRRKNNGLELIVADNGPEFPNELTPGYGVKSIYDKLDLLFPNEYEVHFVNDPEKKVFIQIHKLMKNEPGI